MAKKKTTTETIKVRGEEVVETIKKAVNEGNVRRIVVTSKSGKTVAEFPLTIGVVGAVLAPILAAIGAIVALVTECSITIEREE